MPVLTSKIPTPDSGIEIRKSLCTICDSLHQCGLDLYVQKGKVIKVEGTKENPHNRGTLCPKGAAFRQYLYHEDRIKTPLKRIGSRGSNQFVPISWDEALNTIAEKLNRVKEEYGPESAAFFVGYPKSFRPYLHRLAHSFGSPNYMSESSTCAKATTMAQKLVFGEPAPPDLRNARCIMIWSCNPLYSGPSNARGILEAKERGAKIIAVDPRVTPTTAHAGLHLQLRPGTDGALALAMANVIISEKLYDKDFVADYTHGFEELKDYVRQSTPEKGEELTGVPADKIREAARLYATIKPAALMFGSCGVVHHTNGIQNYRAVFSLVGLTGNFDVAGGNRTVPPPTMLVFAGFLSKEAEFAHAKKWEEMPPRVGQDRFPAWCQTIDEGQAMNLPAQILSGQPYPIKAMIGFGLNYRMWPDSEGFLASLAKLDLFVNVDLFMTDSCKHADIVLPACSSAERSEFRCYSYKYAILTQPAIPPLYQSRSDVDIMFDLANRLGLDDPFFKAGFEASLDWILSPSGLTSEELKKHPAGMPVPNPVQVADKKYLQSGFKTPSGKFEFHSVLLERCGKYDVLPIFRSPKHSRDIEPEMAKEYPFVLDTGSRVPMFIHSRTFRLPWTASLRPNPAADLNPEDAARLGIRQGDDIRIATRKDSIAVKANLTHMVLPGVVHMYHGYPQANVNQMIEADYLDPLSGYPGFKSLLCKIERA
jgi:anaerobic selenocysteine-containing dehydrogenase